MALKNTGNMGASNVWNVGLQRQVRKKLCHVVEISNKNRILQKLLHFELTLADQNCIMLP